MKNSHAQKTSSEWIPTPASGAFSLRQEPATWLGHPAPEPPMRQKQQILKIAPDWWWQWILELLRDPH
jgi:hypothetical protein